MGACNSIIDSWEEQQREAEQQQHLSKKTTSTNSSSGGGHQQKKITPEPIIPDIFSISKPIPPPPRDADFDGSSDQSLSTRRVDDDIIEQPNYDDSSNYDDSTALLSCPSNYDPDVFNSLPLDMQLEVIDEHNEMEEGDDYDQEEEKADEKVNDHSEEESSDSDDDDDDAPPPSITALLEVANALRKSDTAAANNKSLDKGASIDRKHSTGKRRKNEPIHYEYTTSNNNTKETIPNDITHLTISSNVTSIPSSTFENYTQLKSVTFSNEGLLQSIHKRAFYGCTSLSSIIIPSSVKFISNDVFHNCTCLKSITFNKEGLTNIGTRCFAGCTSLQIHPPDRSYLR